MSHLTILDQDLPFQALMGPLIEVENKLARLQIIQRHLVDFAEIITTEHSDAAEHLYDASAKIMQTMQYFFNQRWFILLTIRQGLQNHLRRHGRLPSLDVDHHRAG